MKVVYAALAVLLIALFIPVLFKEGFDDYLNALMLARDPNWKPSAPGGEGSESARLQRENYCSDGTAKMSHIEGDCTKGIVTPAVTPGKPAGDAGGGGTVAIGSSCRTDYECKSGNCNRITLKCVASTTYTDSTSNKNLPTQISEDSTGAAPSSETDLDTYYTLLSGDSPGTTLTRNSRNSSNTTNNDNTNTNRNSRNNRNDENDVASATTSLTTSSNTTSTTNTVNGATADDFYSEFAPLLERDVKRIVRREIVKYDNESC
jgi:hypothetical protein